MPYTIRITRTRTVTHKVGKQWQVVGQELADPGVKTVLKDVYGYTPEIEKEGIEEVAVLQQTVDDDLDMAAVIRAINKL